MSTKPLNKNATKLWTGLNLDGAITGEFDYITGIDLTADVTLTEIQCKAGILEIATGSASKAIIIPTAFAVPGKIYIVVNGDASLAASIKVAGGTAVTVAATKTAIVRVKSDGAEVLRVTADA